MSTPAADTLTKAADRLEDLARHFQGYVDNWQDTPGRFGGPVDVWHYDNVERFGGGGDWIQAMSPAVARPLVMWLRDNANRALEYQHSEHALDFAELILGETE